ncbi:MAG: glucosaminidase domain-containing protein [Clostridiales bacterium]|nr:glucosaminidase domain-containing protein [Clostridiales bacterium]
MKKITAAFLMLMLCTTAFAANWQAQYPWAVDAVNYCMNTGILVGADGNLLLDQNITRSQMAKLITASFSLDKNRTNSFSDTDPSVWDYEYINAIEPYMLIKGQTFNGYESVSREEFAATIMAAMGASDGDTTNLTVYNDYNDIDRRYRGAVAAAVENDVLKGADYNINPKNNLIRAEACTMLHRAIMLLPESQRPVAGDVVKLEGEMSTDLIGDAQISVEQAKAWARDKGATAKFINIADTYWYYGRQTGLRPEILYAQAALETGYGKYGGVVTEDMNNWAGIKVANRNDDAKEAHESFETPEEGVRAHFNHVCAYVGLAPIGTPHARYWSVLSLSWAGTIRTLEQFSGRWCPDPEYAIKIYDGCLIPMSKY